MAIPDTTDKTQIKLRARADADDVLTRFGPSQVPVDPIHIARELGCRVFTTNTLDPGERARAIFTADGANIYLDDAMDPKSSRFACAYALGHVQDPHHPKVADTGYVDQYHDHSITADHIYAETFALYLLMPGYLLRPHMLYKPNHAAIADDLDVSESAVHRRLDDLR